MRAKRWRTYLFLGVLSAAILVTVVPYAAVQMDRFENRELPQHLTQLKLASPAESSAIEVQTLHRSLQRARGVQEVIVRLKTGAVASLERMSLAELNHDRDGARLMRQLQIETEQDGFLNRCRRVAPGARVLARVQKVLNAVLLEVDAAALPAIARDPAVMHIRPVGNYEIDLTETVPYIGGTAVQQLGFDGTGVRIAILDSGIDYLHADLGGSGDPGEYESNDPTVIEPGTFPTAKVVDGYDFVGADWPNDVLLPDPDPLDAGVGGGHGTHVADITAGIHGVAPGASLYAVKVCSSVSTACSGVALLQGMEFAVDPDGDGFTGDHVDIVNMSLGSGYGQPFDDDLSTAVDNATALGVLTVASAGNGGDKPFILGSPSAAPTALSVAQTAVPSSVLPLIEVLTPQTIAGFYEAVFQTWSAPLTGVIEGPVQYADGAGGNLTGCAPFTPGSLAGKIVLVDRGACNFTLKVKNVGDAGGLVGIIGLIAPGDPFAGGDGGDRPITIPGYMISQMDALKIKSGLAAGVTARLDPEVGIPLVMTVVSSSSRGPQFQDFRVKPEIAAPGASVSAEYGTGTERTPFGGTSGAAPMVTGSAALLLDAYPSLPPHEVKARLMNYAEIEILNEGAGPLASISRIGGGEVRVDRAVASQAAAWDATDPSRPGSLGFGFVDVSMRMERVSKTVTVKNDSRRGVLYRIAPSFRSADDEALGAVQVVAPRFLWVPGRSSRSFLVRVDIRGDLLPNNTMSSGAVGANPGPLTLHEVDGYLSLEPIFSPDHEVMHLPWHVLPRKSAAVTGRQDLLFINRVANVNLRNWGVGPAQNDAYSLIALSDRLPTGGPGEQAPTPDFHAIGVSTYPVPAGYCSAQASFVWAFAVKAWERQTHADVPGIYWFDLDTDQDGTPDYAVYNYDLAGLGSIADGRNVTWAAPYVNYPNTIGPQTAFFYTEHGTNTANTLLLICGEQVGLSGPDILSTSVDVEAYAYDIYFGGPGDHVGGLTITPLGEQFLGLPPDIPGLGSGGMPVVDFGPWFGNSPELGILLFTNGDRGSSSRGGATPDTEGLVFRAPPMPSR